MTEIDEIVKLGEKLFLLTSSSKSLFSTSTIVEMSRDLILTIDKGKV
jgi:hypothetical protein